MLAHSNFDQHLLAQPRWNLPTEGDLLDMLECIGDTPFDTSPSDEHLLTIPPMFLTMSELVDNALDAEQAAKLGAMHDLHDHPEALLAILNNLADVGVNEIYDWLTEQKHLIEADTRSGQLVQAAHELNELAQKIQKLHLIILEKHGEDDIYDFGTSVH